MKSNMPDRDGKLNSITCQIRNDRLFCCTVLSKILIKISVNRLYIVVLISNVIGYNYTHNDFPSLLIYHCLGHGFVGRQSVGDHRREGKQTHPRSRRRSTRGDDHSRWQPSQVLLQQNLARCRNQRRPRHRNCR